MTAADPILLGTSYVPLSVAANVPITGDPTSSIQITIPLIPGQTAIISYSISIDSLPATNTLLNTATVDYKYIPAVGVPPIAVTVNTNTVSTLVFALSRGVRFI